jgi:molecular chaperone GrpE
MQSSHDDRRGSPAPGEAGGHKPEHGQDHPKPPEHPKHGAENNKRIHEFEQKLKEAEAKYEEMLDTARRMKAEYENSRKRSDAQYQERLENEKASIMKEFIQVCDNLERAAASLPGDAGQGEWKKGLEMVLKQFRAVLAKFGVIEINPTDAAFDPNEHEALMVAENPGVLHETVSEVLEKGYRLNAKIIRHAKVRVDRPAAGAEAGEKNTTPAPGKGSQEDANG